MVRKRCSFTRKSILGLKHSVLITKKKIELFYETSPGGGYSVLVYFNKKNDLVMDDCLFGNISEMFRGDFDYERFLTVKKEDVDKVFIALNVEKDNIVKLLKLIYSKFNGIEAWPKYEEFLKFENIPYSYSDY